jgi:hypothetical protein
VTASQLYMSPFIKSFYFLPPSEVVSFDTTYCNGSISVAAPNPLPLVLECVFLHDRLLELRLPEGTTFTAALAVLPI